MCGAFSILHPFRDLSQRFNAGYNDSYEKPRYNIRPSQPIPIISNIDPSNITFAMWGIRPAYDKTNKIFLINARDDSLLKPTWKRMLQENRCIIPADGFYEWKKLNTKTKTPYRFELKDKSIFSFAGLWHEELDSSGKPVPHCVIITTEPNSVVSDIHDRMPAILDKEEESLWLNPDLDIDSALKLVNPYPADRMSKYEISTLVNSPANDTEEILLPAQNSA